MKLTTPIQNRDPKEIIHPSSKILTVGSCFSDKIGNKLQGVKFDSLVNPFGTVFNPISMCKLLTMAIEDRSVESNVITEYDDRFFHYDFHSQYDASDADTVVSRINTSIEKVKKHLNGLDVLILTFGTSIGYKRLISNELVSNCHKVPQKQFQRFFIDQDDMYVNTCKLLKRITEINPNLEVVLTVSPVRHTKEGMEDNTRSKSRLIELSHRLKADFSNVNYFPSYEIMMDELRDYRFYNADMIHPSVQAIDIIWDRFIESYFSDSSKQKTLDIQKLNQAMSHRSFNPSSPAHRRFCESQLRIIDRLQKEYIEVDFSEYITHYRAYIA